jgi:hypothetical protein
MRKGINMSIIQRFIRNKAKILLSILIFIPLVYWWSHITGPETEKNFEQLEKEIKQINHEAGMTLIDYYVRKKSGVVLVTEKLSTKKDYDTIFKYYKNEFEKNNWILCCVKEYSDSKSMLFSKKDHTARVTYEPGDTSNLTIGLSWGLGGCAADCK